jgi:hypothetical protein
MEGGMACWLAIGISSIDLILEKLIGCLLLDMKEAKREELTPSGRLKT